MRDSQRSKVYVWERQLPGWYVADAWIGAGHSSAYRSGSGKSPLPLDNIRQFVKEAWADYYGENSNPPQIKDGRGQRSATGSRWELKFPLWSRTPIVICHELAHAMTKDRHGPEFSRCFLELMARYIGLDKVPAYKAGRARGVKFGSWEDYKKPTRRVRKSTKQLLVLEDSK